MSTNYRTFGYLRQGRRSDVYRWLFGYPNLIKRLQARDIMKALELSPGDRVLDLGCSYGVFTIEMAKVAREAIGVDINEPEASKYVPADMSDRLRFLTVDGRSLPFGDAYFDVVLASEVLMMIPEPTEFLVEVKRVLKPGGRLVTVNGLGHPAIERAYRDNTLGLRLARRLWPARFPSSYDAYVNALRDFFATAFSFRPADYYLQVLERAGFLRSDDFRSPTDATASLISWDQFLFFLRTGRPNPSRFFFTKYVLFSLAGLFSRHRTIGGLITVSRRPD